ncbi:MAG: ribonuclease P protein component [Ruminococcaceae bacterium]|nr:ribonuclease P protein component [Oscillospiraceae bacterium]
MKEIAIKENHLYNKTFKRGKRFAGRYVAVSVLRDYAAKRLMLANPKKAYVNRIGLSVPKREGGAVARNRAKRIIREALRHIEKKRALKRGWLIVISSRPTVIGAKSTDIERDLSYIFGKLDMYAEDKT